MKQNPSRLKYRKNHKVSLSYRNILDKKTFFPVHGSYALKSLGSARMTLKQIEAGRKSIRRNIKKSGEVFIRVFTGKSVTSKGLNSRMGKGKGSHSYWMCPIRRGQIIYEVASSSSEIMCRKALMRAAVKMPFKTKIIRLMF